MSPIKQPLAKQRGVETGGDTDSRKHEGIPDLSDSSEDAGKVAQQLQTQGDRGELTGALPAPIEVYLGHASQVENRDRADLQGHEDAQRDERGVEHGQGKGVRDGDKRGGAAGEVLEVDDEEHEEDVLGHDENRLAVRSEREGAACKVHGRKRGTQGLQSVHSDGDAGGRAAAKDADDLRDLV